MAVETKAEPVSQAVDGDDDDDDDDDGDDDDIVAVVDDEDDDDDRGVHKKNKGAALGRIGTV